MRQLLVFILFSIFIAGCENEPKQEEEIQTQPEYLYSNGGIWEAVIEFEEPAKQTFSIVFSKDGDFHIVRRSTNEWGSTSTLSDGTYKEWYVVQDAEHEDMYRLDFRNGTVVVHEGERTDYHKNESKSFLKVSDTEIILYYYSGGTDVVLVKQ